MRFNDLFIDTNLPEFLSKEEMYNYFEKMEEGSIEAREKLIYHNIRLVRSEVLTKFYNTPYELKELVAVGIIGLIKSVDTFDTTKGFHFFTYSKKCIDNEILMFMRDGKKYINDSSLDQSFWTDKEGKELKVEDTLSDINSDFVSEYEDNESYRAIRTLVNELPERDKYIIIKYFGFYDNNPMTMQEIADELNLSKSAISKIVKKVLINISKKLKKIGIIDISLKEKIHMNQKKN